MQCLCVSRAYGLVFLTAALAVAACGCSTANNAGDEIDGEPVERPVSYTVHRPPLADDVPTAVTKAGEPTPAGAASDVPTVLPNPLRKGERTPVAIKPAAKPAADSLAVAKPAIADSAAEPASAESEAKTVAADSSKTVTAEPGGKDDTAHTKQSEEGKSGKKPIDPIKENGPIFEGWGKPRLALVFTGREDGYLEPCGCAGLDRMKGGLTRRHTMFKQLRGDGWPLVALDVGGLAKSYGRQAELKFQITVEAMWKLMSYDAIALGASELKLSGTEVAGNVAGVPGRPSPFISANVDLIDVDSGITGRKQIVEAGGLKIGVTAVLGKKFQEGINNPDVKISDPDAGLAKALDELKKEHCDLLVLLAHASLEESEELAKKYTDFEIVVTAGGPSEPPAEKPRIVGRTRMIEVGEKGMYCVVLGLFDPPSGSGSGIQVRYQRVPLDSRFAASKDVLALLKSYQDQIRDLGLAGLRIRAVPNPREETNGAYVGSAKCMDCHEESYRVWKKSGHSKAYETLTKAVPPRNFDPECISCHVVGWHPTKYFPYEGGFLSREKTPHLIDVGCEACHGPGELHVKAETGSNEALQEKYRKASVVTKEYSEKHFCFECHDLDNSPDFDFKTYWPKIEHKEAE